MKIEFKVRGQTLMRADNRSVAGNSYGFLKAGFDFGDDWVGLIKVACFTTSGGSAYDVTLGTGQTCECEVANEALAASATQGGFFYVSVRGVDAVSDATVRGTVNRVRVDLEASGALDGDNSVPATPSETEQILAYLARGTWLHGTAVTGTDTGIVVTTAIEGAAPGVWYINTANGNLYKCSAVTGTSSTWDYVMTLKGEPGEPGEQGEPGEPLRNVNNATAVDSWIAAPGGTVTYALCMADIKSDAKGYDFKAGDVLKYTLSSQTLAVAYSMQECILPNAPSIDTGAFRGCAGLRTITIPASVVSIADSGLRQCTSMTSVRFLGTPESIASNAFSGDNALADIYVPWSEGTVAGAPWGAPTTTQIHYEAVVE